MVVVYSRIVSFDTDIYYKIVIISVERKNLLLHKNADYIKSRDSVESRLNKISVYSQDHIAWRFYFSKDNKKQRLLAHK